MFYVMNAPHWLMRVTLSSIQCIAIRNIELNCAFRDPVATKGFSASLYVPVRSVTRPQCLMRDRGSRG
jgi:hypothetical protein